MADQFQPVSDRQRNLLTRLAMVVSGRYPPSAAIPDVLVFFDTKNDDEPLEPEWIQLWPRVKELVGRSVPARLQDKIETQISAIELVDKAIWDLRVAEIGQVTVLLGAGASAPSPTNIPIVGNLLPDLWRRARKIGRDDLDRLASWCDSRGIQNIEDLLTAAYIANFSAKSSSVTALLDYFLFARSRSSEEDERLMRRGIPRPAAEVNASSIALFQDTLQTLFGLLTSTMISAKPNAAHSALANFLTNYPKTRIITTNYDGCMDEALLVAGIEPEGATGISLPGENPSEAKLIKMHGSINWFSCDSCQNVVESPLRELRKAYEQDMISYPVIGICKTCGGLRRPLLVPPLSLKFMMFPNLVSLWNSARLALESAKILIVVGYSFSEADTYITKMISRYLSTYKGDQRLIVLDTNSGLVPSLRQRFAAHIDGFDSSRVLRIVGSCEQTVPTLLQSLAGTRPPVPRDQAVAA